MKDIRWFINRLKAMSLQEMIWRVREINLQKREKVEVYSLEKSVTDIPLPFDIVHLHIDIDKLPINWDNKNWSEFKQIDLFSSFDYEKYKDKWSAGFQTQNTWPKEPFSPTINISQRIDIGDIRTNWELNRHFQFAALAKSYYCTKDEKYLIELQYLFNNWNTHNLFLHGIEWTSAMEIAIRVNSWVYMFCFLKKSGCDDLFLEKIEHGILVMVDYILKHRSRFSSANNHLIVEMYAVAFVGIITDYAPWRDEAIRVLTEELPRQNCADGINKEMSLHYQSFIMEAYGLLWLLMMKNNIEIPAVWKAYLTAMAEFLADSTDECGTTIEFGDSDEGKILDLSGRIESYYQYILNLMGCILDKKYTNAVWHETLDWIVPKKSKSDKERYIPSLACCRKNGGYTFLRSRDRKIIIGIDHAALGFGSIAAHGHADALSFQMYIDGQPIFVDPGTYIYHCGLEGRNAFRKTENHNTVAVNGKDQSEMLGTFLWGKRAECRLLKFESSSDKTILVAEHNGYRPIIHKRTFIFDGYRTLHIHDELSEATDFSVTFMLGPQTTAYIEDYVVYISSGKYRCELVLQSEDDYELLIRDAAFSERYGMQESTMAVRVTSRSKGMTSRIKIWEAS